MSRVAVSMHHITNHLIVLHGDGTAGCESYYTVWQSHEVDDQPAMLHALGRYVDHFEQRDGEWRIAHRLVITEHTTVSRSPAGPQSRPGLGSRDRNDPSYAALAPDGG